MRITVGRFASGLFAGVALGGHLLSTITSAQIPEGYSTAERFDDPEMARLAEIVRRAPFVKRVLDTMPEMAAVLTPTRQIVVANQAMLVFLGRSEGEFRPGPRPGEIMRCIRAQLSPHGCGNSSYCSQCGAFATIMETMAQGKRAAGECRITISCDGRLEAMDLMLWCSPFDVDDMQFYVLAGVDISDRKRRQALERAFFHDILNTSQSLMTCVDLICQEDDSFKARGLLSSLRRVGEYMLEEILSQRDMLMAENQELRINPALINTRDFLQRLRSLHSHRVTGREEDMHIPGDADNVNFVSDPVLLSRVLGNMIKNALEATRPGQTVTLDARCRGDWLCFTVHNPGFMPQKVQAQVFQRSFSTKGEGRGLGTYSMRMLSERYLEGGVDFESSEDKGTMFQARLPVNPGYVGDITGHRAGDGCNN